LSHSSLIAKLKDVTTRNWLINKKIALSEEGEIFKILLKYNTSQRNTY